jgi:hypothetical protein
MKAFYYENNGYNGVLLVSGDRWISYDEVIDGIDINRSTISEIVNCFNDNSLDDADFDSLFETLNGSLVCGVDGTEDCLNEQDYFIQIYEN